MLLPSSTRPRRAPGAPPPAASILRWEGGSVEEEEETDRLEHEGVRVEPFALPLSCPSRMLGAAEGGNGTCAARSSAVLPPAMGFPDGASECPKGILVAVGSRVETPFRHDSGFMA